MTHSTYSVPKGLCVVLVSASPKILDKPKSAIFGTMFLSTNMLSGFKSKCKRGSSRSLWIYFKPSHIPLIILYRVFQSSPQDSSALVDKRNINQSNTNNEYRWKFCSMTLNRSIPWRWFWRLPFCKYSKQRALCVFSANTIFPPYSIRICSIS